MLLDEEEKIRFIKYLEVTAETCIVMAEQFTKLTAPVMNQLVERETLKAAACLLIASDLKSGEPYTIGKGENNE